MTDKYRHLDENTVKLIARELPKTPVKLPQDLSPEQSVTLHDCDLIGTYGMHPREIQTLDSIIAVIKTRINSS